jgi:S-adenosylmethionine:tRNA ribosyltransferase-isomerase
MSEIDLYDYELPRERIAQEPLATRSDARLMLIDRSQGAIDHYHVRDLPELLHAEDALVLNNSRVIPARLVGYRSRTGGRWQGLFLRADSESGVWEVLTKTRGKLEPGETLTVQDREARDGMRLTVVSRTEQGHLLVMPGPPEGAIPQEWLDRPEPSTPLQWLERYGRVPLPPYIRDGQMVDADVQNYQTVYAREGGSVAAPTAGLHFTQPLLDEISKGQTATSEVTLHVGIGTFRPIEAEQLSEHRMHSEWGQIGEDTCRVINERRAAGGRCVAVGTTSVRVLESAAEQGQGELQPWTGTTDLFIKPPYDCRVVDALMTNFHLPKSSLLVLVSALAGRELIQKAYRTAIEQEYRFYSYGDAMLII